MKKITAKDFIEQLKPEFKIFIKDNSDTDHSFHEWILILMEFCNELHSADCPWHKDWHACNCGAFYSKKDKT